jgi:mono/diheme cytochrome c family protein
MGRVGLLVYLVVMLGGGGVAWGHPAAAEPVEHMFVFGFERFYGDDDDDDYLAGGGELLLGELNCAACHEVPAALREVVPVRGAPDLRSVGRRLAAEDLWLMVRNPQAVRRGSPMPALFVGEDRDEDELDAIASYVAAWREGDDLEDGVEPGDSELGKKLYHTVGCVVCHSPGMDYVPPLWAEDGGLVELPGLPSVPIALGDRYGDGALAAYLMDPAASHGDGRKAGYGLTAEEAGQLAAYLKLGKEFRILPAEGLFEPEAALIEPGARAFVARGCAACHDMGVGRIAPPGVGGLVGLRDLEGGCLSERPAGGRVPYFDLSALQRRALRVAIGRIQAEVLGAGSAGFQRDGIGRLMAAHHCSACHQEGGRGGLERGRAGYFVEAGTDMHLLEDAGAGLVAPDLEGVWGRLGEARLRQGLCGGEGEGASGVRRARYGADVIERLLREWGGADFGLHEAGKGVGRGL